ncbi:nuclear transport factor 2 family protein [Streptomyces chartreusis]|uniref:nuclear transport factor 2 family protein n=1 Tax=Streptomyces chartreusis TaxID=1969 RepID=UPI0036B67FC5
MNDALSFQDLINDTRPDAELSREEVIERNLRVVEAHFHNENPDDVDKAIALYADGIVWEAPCRGMVYTDPAEVRKAYFGIFRTIKYNKTTALRRFATETSVFDDQIADVEVVGNEMPNLGYPIGTRLNARLVHCFEMRDGRITREIAYEMLREHGGSLDHDSVPEGAHVVVYDPSAF